MSIAFRLKYLLGLIPTTQKLDTAWDNLVKMRDNLQKIEKSAELKEFNELKALVESTEFQQKKREIVSLVFKGSSEYKLLTELKNLENLKSVRQYFQLHSSPDLDKFYRISDGDQLRRFNELKKLTESPEFVRRKKEVESLNFKHSPEYKLQQQFLSLKKSNRLKKYYKTIGSNSYLIFLEIDPHINGNSGKFQENDPKVKTYRKFLKSNAYENLKAVENQKLTEKFENLKHETNSKHFLEHSAFLKDKKRYETTPDFKVLSEYLSISKSEEIKFWTKFNSSALFQNYLKMKDSKELERLETLKKQTSNDDFKKKVAFLQNRNRFKTTEEYKSEMAFKELDSSKMLAEYRKLKKTKKLDFFNNWSMVFEENFSSSKLDAKVWQPENYWGFKMAGTTFSQDGEVQGYNGLHNVQLSNNILSIVAKKEKVEGKVWKPTVGLVPKHFDYSSAMINSGDSFRIEKGIVETKVRFSFDSSITSALSLTGNKPFPQIDLFRSSKSGVGLGIVDKSGLKSSPYYIKINGLKSSNYHIYRFEITSNELVWKINGSEVFREAFAPMPGGMFLNFVTSLHSPVNEHLLPHRFEIDWIRCFTANN